MFTPVNGLVVRSWKQDVINVIHTPRTKIIPDISPYGLKLETWLRFNKLDYLNVSNDFTKGSSKGQIPFIEVNGRQFADTNFIIENLIQQYNLNIDQNLTAKERAESRAILILIEESLVKFLFYDRCRGFKWFASSEQGFLDYFTGVKKIFFQKVAPFKAQSNLKKVLNAHGYGRHSLDEAHEIVKKDLNALSTLLGDKHYLFGDKPTSIDASIFGVISSLYFTPLNSDVVKPFMEQNTQNLIEYIKRIKTEYWPDWDETCSTLDFNAHVPKPTPPQPELTTEN